MVNFQELEGPAVGVGAEGALPAGAVGGASPDVELRILRPLVAPPRLEREESQELFSQVSNPLQTNFKCKENKGISLNLFQCRNRTACQTYHKMRRMHMHMQ